MSDKDIQDTYQADDIKSAPFKEQAVKSPYSPVTGNQLPANAAVDDALCA